MYVKRSKNKVNVNLLKNTSLLFNLDNDPFKLLLEWKCCDYLFILKFDCFLVTRNKDKFNNNDKTQRHKIDSAKE